MTSNNTIDAARVELLLSEFRLPAIKLMWAALAARADKEGWPAARFLAALAEHEMADRGRRRIERHLASARLPAGKTFDTFDFNAVPIVSKAQVMALAAGDGWLDQGANILLFGPPGGGQEPSCGGARSGFRSERPARAVHAHHRPRPTAAGGAPGARA
jgi:DNA replication protein DnaC